MQADGDSGNLPITNTLFPPPPPYFSAYTTANITSAKDAGGSEAGDGTATHLLEKPRVDWVKEEGRWMCFGQMYTTQPMIPTAETIGLPAMIDPEEPPQTSLPPLLHSFLHTLLLLLDTLTNTARIPGELESRGWAHEGDQVGTRNGDRRVLRGVNQLRTLQAESTLVLLLESQLEARKAQTAQIRSRNEAIAARLRALKQL